MTLDQIEVKVKQLMSQHIGVFSNFDELKAEIFDVFVQLISHLKALEDRDNAKTTVRATVTADHVPDTNS